MVGIDLSLSGQGPADPVAEGATHHQFLVGLRQPGQLFREETDALLPGAGHPGDVGAPEHAVWPEGVVNLVQVVVDVGEGIGLAGVAGRAGLPVALASGAFLPLVGQIAEANPGVKLVVDHMGRGGGKTDAEAWENLSELLDLDRRAS